MAKNKKQTKLEKATKTPAITLNYNTALTAIVNLLHQARIVAARTVNSVMTRTYFEIGRSIIELEQHGKTRADYGKGLLEKLSTDLTTQFGRGFSVDNLENMRLFYIHYNEISETPSRKLKDANIIPDFQLSWSHYVLLLRYTSEENKRTFYETEALRGGWSIRQMKRQMNSLFYERTMLSKNKPAMLTRGTKAKPKDLVTPEEEIKDPFVLEFLNLKDEYSEYELEEALIRHLETFLLELGDDFAFIGRQRRLRIGDQWFRVDLLFFHRRLKCLVIIDLKTGEFTHADVGQMHLYLNYAKEHWVKPDENPPVGLILCSHKNEAVARYTLANLPNKVLAAQYKTNLPSEKQLLAEIERTRHLLETHTRKTAKKKSS